MANSGKVFPIGTQPDVATERVYQQMTGGAAHVIHNSEVPRSWIVPTVAGVLTSEILLDAGATTTVKELVQAICTVGSTDLVTAGVAIETRGPDTPYVIPGEPVMIITDSAPILDIYACGLSGSADAAASNAIAFSETTDATIRAALTHFEFAAGDNVRTAFASITPIFGTIESAFTYGQYARLRVWGKSHN